MLIAMLRPIDRRRPVAILAGLLLSACGQAPQAGPSQPSARSEAPVVSLTPAPDARLAAGAPVVVGATFGARIDVASARLRVAGRDVTADAEVLPQSVRYRIALPPGRYEAQLDVRQADGAAWQRQWRFEVVATPSILPEPPSPAAPASRR